MVWLQIRESYSGCAVKTPCRETKQWLSDEILEMCADKVSVYYTHCIYSGFINSMADWFKSQKMHSYVNKKAEDPASLQHNIILQNILKIFSLVIIANMSLRQIPSEISHTFLLITVSWMSLYCIIVVC